MTNTATRIQITGMGAVSACGDTLGITWQAIKDGRSGIDRIERWDVSGWKYPLGGEVKTYNPRTMLKNRKLLRVISRHDVLGLCAADQAIADSRICEYAAGLADATRFNERTGVYVASPGNQFEQQHVLSPIMTTPKADLQYFAEHLFEKVHPMWLLRILPNNVMAYTGIQYGFKGANQNIVNHVVGGFQAIIEAAAAIQVGQIDRAVVVGYDGGLDPQLILYYAETGLLSRQSLVKSFDQSHDGTLLAEGAGALVLESEQSAAHRQAPNHGQFVGGATTSESAGILAIRDDGRALQKAMQRVLTDTQVSTDQIGMLCAHGNGNPISDITESIAIQGLFGDRKVPVSGFKWALGHSLCAAGVLDVLLSLNCLREGVLPGIHGFDTLSHGCRVIAVSRQSRPLEGDYGLVLSRGFSSLNGCVLLRKPTS
jgi:3-oxoacyl-[acyl-carrier-protein] synthase-1